MAEHAYLGTRKGLFELARDGAGWTLAARHFLGDPVTMVLPDQRDGTLYAALNLGHFGVKLQRRDAGSAQWNEIAAPAYPFKPDGSADPVEWKLRMIWSLAAGGADEPGVLWAGTLPGALLRSGDRGDSWQLVEALWNAPQRAQWFGGGYDVPGIHSICVDPRDSGQVLVGVSCGGAWRTQDGGASWALSATGMRASYMPPGQNENEAVQDPHRIVRSSQAPDQLWCQHHNGIWRSSDAGQTWAEVLQALLSNFGFALAVHGERAWFVPAQSDQLRIPVDAALAVTSTDDGGKTFSVLRGGLPQQLAATALLRPGVPPRPGGRRRWPHTSDGLDHWRRLELRRCRRALANPVGHDASGVRRLFRLSTRRRAGLRAPVQMTIRIT